MGKSNQVERKTFAFKLDAPPDDAGHFSGYASVFGNVDKGGDIVEASSVTKTLNENPSVPVFWVHNYVKVPVGIGTLSRDEKGVRLDADLFIETSELAREIHGAMKGGAVKGLSIGYNTLKRTFKNGVRHLQEIAIGEVSLCPFPMNPLAEVDDVKHAKWLGQYGATESVDCLLSMISAGADFLASEVEEGDTADATAMTSVLATLTTILASELADVAAGEAEGEEPDYVVWVEEMRAPITLAVKKLEALLTREPAQATHGNDGAAEQENAQPALATLRDLMADITSA